MTVKELLEKLGIAEDKIEKIMSIMYSEVDFYALK